MRNDGSTGYESTLSNLSSVEVSDAVTAISGSDEDVGRLAGEIARAVEAVNSETRRAFSQADALYHDDTSNPIGVQRQLAEIPQNLISATADQLDRAEVMLDTIEGVHLTRILRHDGREDANRRAELANYTADLKSKDAVAVMVKLAANPRYSTYLSGAMGESLAARYNFDHAILRKVALETLAVNGTPDQVARSAALASAAKMRRVIQLCRSGRDHIAQEVQRPPKPAPSAALM